MLEILLSFLLILITPINGENNLKKLPHIIFILADDLGWNDVSFHGSQQIPTPNIDTLALTGSVLQNYYATPICTPSRSALMTGKHPIRNGMQNYVVDIDSKYGLPLTEKIMPQYLKDLGYATHLVGKWHLGHSTKAQTPNYRGFDSFYGYYLFSHDYYDHTADNEIWNGYDMRRNMEVDYSSIGNYSTTLFANEAEKIISHHDPSSGPLFLYLAHLAPHSANSYDPLQAPQETIALFDHIEDPKRKVYAAMVYEMDKSIGKVVNALKENNMLGESIIVFSGDNGGAVNGMSNNAASNWPLKGAKNTTWEGGVRTTGIVWSPLFPTERRGVVINDLFDITDWLPTFLEAAGESSPSLEQIDGVSQWKTIFSGRPSLRTQLLHNIDHVFGYAGVRMGRYKLVKGSTENGDFDDWFGPTGKENSTEIAFDISRYHKQLIDSEAGKAITSLGFKLPQNLAIFVKQFEIFCGERPINATPCNALVEPHCLFDIENDPCEYDNLAQREPGIVQQLEDLLQWYESSSVPPLYPQVPLDPNANPIYWNCTVTYWEDLVFEPTSACGVCPPKNGGFKQQSSSYLIHLISMIIFL